MLLWQSDAPPPWDRANRNNWAWGANEANGSPPVPACFTLKSGRDAREYWEAAKMLWITEHPAIERFATDLQSAEYQLAYSFDNRLSNWIDVATPEVNSRIVDVPESASLSVIAVGLAAFCAAGKVRRRRALPTAFAEAPN